MFNDQFLSAQTFAATAGVPSRQTVFGFARDMLAFMLSNVRPAIVREFLLFSKNASLRHNFTVVVPDRVYRSGEIRNQRRLACYLRKHGIKTVLNVRYSVNEKEKATVESVGAKYLHVRLKSNYMPARCQMESLLASLDQAELPLLIHCTSGQHRSAVVAAIWLMTKENKGADEAISQLSLKYGYFKVERLYREWRMGHPLFEGLLNGFLAFSKSHSNADFRSWSLSEVSGLRETPA